MSLKPSQWKPSDSRQRAPFAHTSSSADLTSVDIVSPLRAFQPLPPTRYADDVAFQESIRPRTPAPNPFRLPQLSIPGYDTLRFISLCTLWYASSALSSNTGKVILNRFRFPVTLTIVQFFFVAFYCILCSWLGWTTLKKPSRAIFHGVLPMAAFQVGGHIFGSLAISRVPVSTVHTIKALSPLFTVLTYAVLFGVSYSYATYLSLLPLTLGVMLACSFDVTISNFLGLICAFGSTLIFVSQNIFFKKIMPTNSDTIGLGAKLDKINLLYFSSSMAFTLMIPVWIYSDASRVLAHQFVGESIGFYLIINGAVHFAQNLLAFAILSSTSPVTYSIASLIKRIAVICLAIVWFKQSVHPIQAVGIALTAIGLWMYNNAKRDVERGEKRMRQVEAVRGGVLPISKTDIFEKVPHSPKPVYVNPPKSAPLHTHHVPYPSPPPSDSSSPPSEAITMPTRHRRLSDARGGLIAPSLISHAVKESPIELTA